KVRPRFISRSFGATSVLLINVCSIARNRSIVWRNADTTWVAPVPDITTRAGAEAPGAAAETVWSSAGAGAVIAGEASTMAAGAVGAAADLIAWLAAGVARRLRIRAIVSGDRRMSGGPVGSLMRPSGRVEAGFGPAFQSTGDNRRRSYSGSSVITTPCAAS